jgi:2-dehydro-3-deoxyphosphogluconate aldolase/(4S)-4-hydroxy-2-oxoglutarate aldolase
LNANVRMRDAIIAARVVPVVVLGDAGRAVELGRALGQGGLTFVEVTFRTAAAEKVIAAMSEVGGLTVGAGTVTEVLQMDRAVDAGASFIVSPGLSEAVVRRGEELGVGVLPGVSTATEIMRAVGLGCTTVKFFPAEASGGLATVAALAAPFPSVRFVPTGGIDAELAAVYLAHPSVIAVGGSWMVPADHVAAADWPHIVALARRAAAIGATAVGTAAIGTAAVGTAAVGAAGYGAAVCGP